MYPYHKFIFALLLCASFVFSQAQEESVGESCGGYGLCCGTDPSPAGVMISHVHDKNEWMISYRYMNMGMNGVLKGSSTVSTDEIKSLYTAIPQDMRMNMHMLMAMYGVTDRLTVMGMFHYNTAWMQMSMRMGNSFHRHNMQTSGLGDTKITALYAIVKETQQQLLLSLGLNLPTGSIQQKGPVGGMMYPGQRYPYNMQNGSGTIDFQPCISYLRQHSKFYYSVQASAVLRSNANSVGYRYGNELSLGAWAAYRWLEVLSNSLRLEAVHTEPLRGKDPSLDPMQEIAANPANYGGQKINVYLGAVYQAQNGFLRSSKFCAEFGLPLYQNYLGYQMKNTYNLLITYNLSF